MKINKVGMFIGATIALTAGIGAAIVTAKIAIVALAVLALIGAVVFTVSCIRSYRVSKELKLLKSEYQLLMTSCKNKENPKCLDQNLLLAQYHGENKNYKENKDNTNDDVLIDLLEKIAELEKK